MAYLPGSRGQIILAVGEKGRAAIFDDQFVAIISKAFDQLATKIFRTYRKLAYWVELPG